MPTRPVPTEPAERLRQLRLAAGYSDMESACDRFGFKYEAYKKHENAERTIRQYKAEVYARAYKSTAAYILTGNDPVEQLPPDEAALIRKYRMAPPSGRKYAHAVLDASDEQDDGEVQSA